MSGASEQTQIDCHSEERSDEESAFSLDFRPLQIPQATEVAHGAT